MALTGKKPFWNLSVYITSLSTEKPVEVNGETFVGKLMLDLVEGLGNTLLRVNYGRIIEGMKYHAYRCGGYDILTLLLFSQITLLQPLSLTDFAIILYYIFLGSCCHFYK